MPVDQLQDGYGRDETIDRPEYGSVPDKLVAAPEPPLYRVP
jgi:hypothetical protein